MEIITGKRYEIKNNEEKLLKQMNFDAEDIQEVFECREKDPSHMLLLFINKDGSTISITPSDADIHFWVLYNEKEIDIINETLEDIREFILKGDIVEL